jgi:hypothetical protein
MVVIRDASLDCQRPTNAVPDKDQADQADAQGDPKGIPISAHVGQFAPCRGRLEVGSSLEFPRSVPH